MNSFDVLRDAYKFAKQGGIIPSETPSGQLSMLTHGYGKAPKPSPPFAGGVRRSTNPKERVKVLARREELARMKSGRAINDAPSEMARIGRIVMGGGQVPRSTQGLH